MKNYFISWFYSEQANDESYYPSVGGSSSSAEFQYVYWRCIYVLYRSALITNRDIVTDWLFFTNVKNLPTVDGVDFGRFFEENQIQVVYLELTRKTPKDWYGAWRNQFYLFDVLEYLKNLEGNHLILDSDCVIAHSLQDLYQEIEREQVLTLPIDYSIEKDINGCSMEQMRQIYQKMFDTEYPKNLLYMGGEFIAMASEAVSELLPIFYDIWEKDQKLYEQKEQKLNEEAHTLSLCYYRMGKVNELGRKYIRRIWTDMNLDQVKEGDDKLAIWHLPAEKKFGFAELFKRLKNRQNITPEELLRISDSCMKLTATKEQRKRNWYVRYGKNKIKKLFIK